MSIKPIDYIAYMDTDSLYIQIGRYITDNITDEKKWNQLSNDTKTEYVVEITNKIKDELNERAFTEIQKKIYGSVVDDFKINFDFEKISSMSIFVKKKKNISKFVWIDGLKTDKIKTTGLEIVRSDLPEIIREKLKIIAKLILNNTPDSKIETLIHKYKKELLTSLPEEIAVNIGIKNIKKYLTKEGKPQKGTLWHIKGVYGYRLLRKLLKIENKYPDIQTNEKAKVVYLKKNKYNINVMTFIRWPYEFNKHIYVDYQKMIEKHFLIKIGFLLGPLNKLNLLESDKTLSLF